MKHNKRSRANGKKVIYNAFQSRKPLVVVFQFKTGTSSVLNMFSLHLVTAVLFLLSESVCQKDTHVLDLA